MTRKDYILIANAIRSEKIRQTRGKSEAGVRTLHDLSRVMADALSSTNPAFDHGKFMDACAH